MSDFKRIPIKIDAATCHQINDYGAVVTESEYFRLLFDETVILCCEFYDVDWSSGAAVLTPHPINPTLSLAAFGDNDFDAETAFMFLTEQSAIAPDTDGVNDIGDWHGDTTADPAQGQLSFKVNTNTDRFTEAVGSGGSYKKYYFVITGVPEGETAKTVLAYFRFKAENRPSSSAGMPATADPEYYDAQQIDALLKAGYELQFSIDGSTLWHDTQAAEDLYWRYRYPGGVWSDGIKMIDNSDFSGYGTKEAFVDADTLLANDSANSGNPITMTLLKAWNYVKSKADTVYAAITHSHAISEITDLQTSLDGKQDVLGFTPENSANKGTANGYAELDAAGKVPSAQLPAYVDDVLEYPDFASLPVTSESGKIYVTLDDNKTYRWSGSAYVEISASLALGETESTAHRGDHGKAAYDHSQLTSGNPHVVTKTDVNLGNVDNTSDADKPVSTAQQAALNNKQDSLGFTPENSANKGVANGYAGLDADGKVPASQLPKITANQDFTVGTAGKYSTFITRDGVAVDKGDGTVGIPVYHNYMADGDSIKIEGTANYDGTYAVETGSTTSEIIITATYVAETFPTSRSTAIIKYVQPQAEIDALINFVNSLWDKDFNSFSAYIKIRDGYYNLAGSQLRINNLRNITDLFFDKEATSAAYTDASTNAWDTDNKPITIESTNSGGTLMLAGCLVKNFRLGQGVELKNSSSSSSGHALYFYASAVYGTSMHSCRFSVAGSTNAQSGIMQLLSVGLITTQLCTFSGGYYYVSGDSMSLSTPCYVEPYPSYGIGSGNLIHTTALATNATIAACRHNPGLVSLNGTLV